MARRQDRLPVCSASALAVDWNRVVLNQMLHTFLSFLRRGEEGGQKDRREVTRREGGGGRGKEKDSSHATQSMFLQLDRHSW